jgi:hypothetical protein
MLEEIIGLSFRFFDNVGQPLNYFADLITQLPQFGERGLHIKFSYFGDLFTIEVGAIHSQKEIGFRI